MEGLCYGKVGHSIYIGGFETSQRSTTGGTSSCRSSAIEQAIDSVWSGQEGHITGVESCFQLCSINFLLWDELLRISSSCQTENGCQRE